MLNLTPPPTTHTHTFTQVFPDEVDTPLDVPARVRFGKYRGLKSFRASPWDPLESLPPDYARIFSLPSYEKTARKVIGEAALVERAMLSLEGARLDAEFSQKKEARVLVSSKRAKERSGGAKETTTLSEGSGRVRDQTGDKNGEGGMDEEEEEEEERVDAGVGGMEDDGVQSEYIIAFYACTNFFFTR